MCTLGVRKTYHCEYDGRDDEPCGHGIGAVDMFLAPHEGEGRGHYGLNISVEGRMYRREARGAAVEQVYWQHGAEDKQIEDLGSECQGRMPQHVDGAGRGVAYDEGGDGSGGHEITPSEHLPHAQTRELGLDEDGVHGGGDDGAEDDQVAVTLAAAHDTFAAVEYQHGAAGKGEDDAGDVGPYDMPMAQDDCRDEGECGAEGGYCGGVDGGCERGAPQEHVEPSVDYEQGDEGHDGGVAQRQTVEGACDDGRGHEDHNPDQNLAEEYETEVHAAFGEGDVEREVGSEEDVRHHKVAVIVRVVHMGRGASKSAPQPCRCTLWSVKNVAAQLFRFLWGGVLQTAKKYYICDVIGRHRRPGGNRKTPILI